MTIIRKSATPFRAAILSAAVISLSAIPAQANDSTAVIAAGGVRLVKTDAIRMASEDLYVSENRIRVRYVFHPVEKKTMETIIAFPMPVVPIGNMDENIGFPENVTDPVNFMDFKVWADGKPVRPRVQVRALVNGVDMTPILRKYGIPLSDLADPAGFQKRLDALPPQARAELEYNKLVDWRSQWDADNKPVASYHWDLEVLYYWRQKFPDGRDVRIRHEYRPIAGAFFYAPAHPEPWVRKTYCTDKAFTRAARRKVAGQDEYASLLGAEVHYILSTASNWASSIGRFRMVLDKGKPGNLISLCWHGLKKISPTQFEFTARDYEPKGELKVLIVKDLPR